MADQTTPTMIKGEADPRVNHYLTRIQDEHDLNKYDAVTFALEKARAQQLGVTNDDN